MEQLQYPIGRFSPKPDYTFNDIAKLLHIMETSPARYKTLLAGLSEADLARTYRQGSWTVKQLIHHVADIHLLNYLRIKKLLTEEEHIATMIDMNAWAVQADATQAPVSGSLMMLEGINDRFIFLLKKIDAGAFEKSFYHPVRKIHLSMKQVLYMAVWHLEHHMAHMQIALGREPHSFSFDQQAVV
jgi:hypothetical protein